MSKHTPGPWKVFEDEGFARWPGIETADDSFSIVVYGTSEYGDDGGIQGRDEEEALANARLIAAAPDLLEALQAIVSIDEHSALTVEDADAIRAKAIAAINKAVGTI